MVAKTARPKAATTATRLRHTNTQVNQTEHKLKMLTDKVNKMTVGAKVKQSQTKQAQARRRTANQLAGMRTFPQSFNFARVPRGAPGLTLDAFNQTCNKHPVPTAFSTGRSTYHNLTRQFTIKVGGPGLTKETNSNVMIIHPYNNVAAVFQNSSPAGTNPFEPHDSSDTTKPNTNPRKPEVFAYLTDASNPPPREIMPQRMTVQISNITAPTEVSGMVYCLKAPLISDWNSSSFEFIKDYNRTMPYEAVQLLTPHRWNVGVVDQANYSEFQPFKKMAPWEDSEKTGDNYNTHALSKLIDWIGSATGINSDPSGMGTLIFLFDSPSKEQTYNISVKYSVKVRYPLEDHMSQMETTHPTTTMAALNQLRDRDEAKGSEGTFGIP